MAVTVMPSSTLVLVVSAALVLYASVRVFENVKSRQAVETWASARGCRSPPTLDTGRWPLGLELIIKAFKTANEQRLLRLFDEIVGRTGRTFEQRILGFRGVDTVDPTNIEAILNKQFDDFGLGERRLVFFPLLGDGIFTQDGKPWEHSRALLRPAFQRNRDKFFAEVARATDAILEQIPDGKAVDLQPVFFRFTLETTSSLLFGGSLEVLGAGDKDAVDSFAVAFDTAQDYLAKRGRLGGLYWLIDSSDFRRQCKVVHDYIDAAVASSLNGHAKVQDDSSYTIMDGLLENTKDPRVLREQCLNVLLAGRDTTACLLSWTFRLLTSHPKTLLRLRTEIAAVCTSGLPPDRTHLKRMRYLDAVIKEVLRLYPSVPVNSRTANCDTTLPTGGGIDGTAPVLVRKGEAVGYCPYVMHRRTDIFGDDAALFRPERWLENEGRLVTHAGYAYLPFNAGPRACLGQEFAILEASYMTVRLLQTFPNLSLPDSEPIEDVGQERQKLTLVVSSANGCRVVLSR